MNLKVSFLKSIKACLQSNNLHTLSEILPNYVYYPLTKDELYLVCFGFHKIKNFIQSNALIEQAKNSVSDDSLQQQYTRLEIFNYFFLSNFDKTKELVLQFLASSFDEEMIKIFLSLLKIITHSEYEATRVEIPISPLLVGGQANKLQLVIKTNYVSTSGMEIRRGCACCEFKNR